MNGSLNILLLFLLIVAPPLLTNFTKKIKLITGLELRFLMWIITWMMVTSMLVSMATSAGDLWQRLVATSDCDIWFWRLVVTSDDVKQYVDEDVNYGVDDDVCWSQHLVATSSCGVKWRRLWWRLMMWTMTLVAMSGCIVWWRRPLTTSENVDDYLDDGVFENVDDDVDGDVDNDVNDDLVGDVW